MAANQSVTVRMLMLNEVSGMSQRGGREELESIKMMRIDND